MKKSIKRKLIKIKRTMSRSFSRHTHWYVLAGALLYLLTFQYAFVTSSDNWAEAFYEYVHSAVVNGHYGFFHTGIAGYFNFLPKLVSYPYILLGGSLGYIDHYFRLTVIAFALGCITFIAHPYNRDVIKNDLVRALMAIATLLTYYHVSSFSLINVWYIGFVPIILISLHGKKFKHEWQAVLYAAFAIAVCLTKPSLILLPIIIYRMVRLKEYLLGSIIIFAVTLQMLLFFTSSFYTESTATIVSTHTSYIDRIIDTLLYPGLLALKLYGLYPPHIWVVICASAIVISLLALLIWARGTVQVGVLVLMLYLSSYTTIYSPDITPFSVVSSFGQLFFDQTKLQREVTLSFFIILLLFMCANFILQRYAAHRWSAYIRPVMIGMLLFLTILSFRPIDTDSSGVAIAIDPFRTSLADHKQICMPVPPTPKWYYESNGHGLCGKTNFNKTLSTNSFTRTVGMGQSIVLQNPHKQVAKTLLIPVWNPDPAVPSTLTLTNLDTGQQYTAPIPAKHSGDPLTFVAFNLDNEHMQPVYHYTLSEQGTVNSRLALGRFTDASPAEYFFVLPPTTK